MSGDSAPHHGPRCALATQKIVVAESWGYEFQARGQSPKVTALYKRQLLRKRGSQRWLLR